ncbi:hypothetical protein LCGC14_1492830 [marine sediment metagenome]|uniref:Uncharacterized protein n=1 Tax=marine sediment metagenome TaxID=412755 RepID=A0A0F9LLT4_9ZZZZ
MAKKKKKKTPSTELKAEAPSSKSDEALAEANAITPIQVKFNDGYVVGTTVQNVDDVLLQEKARRKRER